MVTTLILGSVFFDIVSALSFFYFIIFFFFNDTASTEIYTLSLHDALPISGSRCSAPAGPAASSRARMRTRPSPAREEDRKSTRLNSSHSSISYAVFCLKKKKKKKKKKSNTTKQYKQ